VVLLMTALSYGVQDFCDSAEEVVEKVAMPQEFEAWVREFFDLYYTPTPELP